VRVLQPGGGLDLGQEPLGAEHGAKFLMQYLDRDLAVVAEVVRQINGGHAPGPKLALE